MLLLTAEHVDTCLGEDARSVMPIRGRPNLAVRFMSLFIPHLRRLTPLLRGTTLDSEKAQRVLGFSPRSAKPRSSIALKA